MEGSVAKIRSRAIKLLNQKAYNISGFAESLNIESDVTEATDDNSAIVEVQFGQNKLFKKSQVIAITIYDGDDYVVELPGAISIFLNIKNHKKFKDLRTTKLFLKRLKQKLDKYVEVQI